MNLTARSTLLLVALTSFAIQPALADSTDGNCEFYKHGDAKHDRWGACSFSQRQGNIDITLKNGTSYSLTQRDDANQYKDQDGNKVHRTQSSSSGQTFEWKNDQQKLVIAFNANKTSTAPKHSSGDYMGKTPDNLRDLVGAKAGQAEGTLRDRGYVYMKGSSYGDDKYGNWEDGKTGRCVTIHTANGHYASIIYAPDFDCTL
jgi:hypothetical protein